MVVNSKRVLLITYKYIPEIAPRVFRWSSIVKEWSREKVNVDIICATFSGTTQEEITGFSHIHRVNPWFKKDQQQRLTNNTSITAINITKKKPPEQKKKDIILIDRVKKYWQLIFASSTGKHEESITLKILFQKIVDKIRSLAKRLLRLPKTISRNVFRKIKKLIRSYLWPDYGMPWIPPAYLRARKLIKEHHYSAIITISWPVSPHVVGSLIHKTIAKNIPWIVDIGDPFSFNKLTQINDFKKFGSRNQKFEQHLLNDASVLTVTTKETKEDYLNSFSAIESKIIVIPPLIPPRNKVEINSTHLGLVNNQKIKLVFTGSLRRKNRRPDILLKLFSQLSSLQEFNDLLELHFFGDVKQCLTSFEPYKELVNEQIFLHGIVEKEVIDLILTQADFLVNIGNVSKNQLPSKLVEYLSANRPIINIATNKNDSSWNFLCSSGIAINIQAATPNAITTEIIEQTYHFIKNPPEPLNAEKLEFLISPFSAKTISARYLQIIESFAKY